METTRLFQSKLRSLKGGALISVVIDCIDSMQVLLTQALAASKKNVPNSLYVYQVVIVYNTSV